MLRERQRNMKSAVLFWTDDILCSTHNATGPNTRRTPGFEYNVTSPSPLREISPFACLYYSFFFTSHFPHFTFTPSLMANYLPVLLVSVSTNAIPDDSSLSTLPTAQVDYLSHEWQEEDVWKSWRNMTKQKKEIANGVRLENASWRTWWKQRNKLKTVTPETLNWCVLVLSLAVWRTHHSENSG